MCHIMFAQLLDLNTIINIASLDPILWDEENVGGISVIKWKCNPERSRFASMKLSKVMLHKKPFAQFLNQMINCSPVFSAAMTLCATHGVRSGLMSHSH